MKKRNWFIRHIKKCSYVDGYIARTAFVKYIRTRGCTLIAKGCMLTALNIAFNLTDSRVLQKMTDWERLLLSFIPLGIALLALLIDTKMQYRVHK